MSSDAYAFCPKCGSLKKEKKICKACTNILRTKEKSKRIANEQKRLKIPQQRKEEHYAQIRQKKSKSKKKNRVSIRYSDTMGIEWIFEPDTDYKRTRVNFCIKCRKNKLHYAGWWVRAGGQYAASDTAKRIFICSDCWKPKK